MKYFISAVFLIVHCFKVDATRACSRNTCLNGGTCTVNDETRMFQCACPPGFSGLLCQDNCSLHCVHGSCTKGAFGNEQCQCFDGWMGLLCDESVVDTDQCDPKCTNGQTCRRSEAGEYYCAGGHVLNIGNTCSCQNNGTCVHDNVNETKCVCPAGFDGKSCENDINECEMSKCLNGASCENTFGGYKCHCGDAFKGHNCETVYKCPNNYCHNGGDCTILDNKLICNCPDGFNGDLCEIATDSCSCENPNHVCSLKNGEKECECPEGRAGPDCNEAPMKPCDMEPCLNGGNCVDDGSNLFTCYCLPSWTGVYCGEPVECLVNGAPCQNGGSCIWTFSNTKCECASNFTGENCEKPLAFKSRPTCNDMRCQNGGSCALNANGEPICKCQAGFDPPFCEPSSPCMMNPCKNGGTCQDADGQYYCHCSAGFTGVHCETVFSESVDHSTAYPLGVEKNNIDEMMINCDDCVHSSKCLKTESSAICICQNGYTGVLCDKRQLDCEAMQCSVGQECGIINSTAICRCPIGSDGQDCRDVTSATFGASSLYIHQSSKFTLGTTKYDNVRFEMELYFRTTVDTAHLATSENIFGEKVLTVGLASGFLTFNVSGETIEPLNSIKINDAHWYKLTIRVINENMHIEIDTEHEVNLARNEFAFNSVIFSTRIGKVSNRDYFVGCLSNVKIDGEKIRLNEGQKSFDIREGCERNEQCSRDYCLNNGVCVDLWEHSSCQCEPPYLKPNCAFALPETTFGHLDSPSIVQLSTSESENHLLRDEVDLSFLLRTKQSSSFLFYIGEKLPNNEADEPMSYALIRIVDGKIDVKYRAGGRKDVELRSKNQVNDNNVHFVRVIISRNRREIFIDKNLEAEDHTKLRNYQDQFVDDVVIGSSPISPVKDKYFKGYLQDIQINDRSVIIHPTKYDGIESIGTVERTSNILEGAVSDPMCEGSVCKHGECHETFNDYYCECARGFAGRNCDRIDYCLEAQCLTGGDCHNTNDGYYCSYPITLKNQSFVSYEAVSQNQNDIETISLSIRTHSTDGHVMTIKNSGNDIKLMINRKKLAIINRNMNVVDMIVADGKWHKIELKPFKVKIDEKSMVTNSELFPINLTDIIVEVGEQSGRMMNGCIKDVRIGVMPVLSLIQNGDETAWKLLKKEKISIGCMSSEQCGIYSTCRNGGTCVDLWNTKKCICTAGFSGEHCEININECEQVDCGNNGYCLDEINNAKCVCNIGYKGMRCETPDENLCNGHKCQNGGECKESQCECTSDWMGESCSIRKTTSCTDSPCQNSGNCHQISKDSFECECLQGFNGTLCESKMVNECDTYECNHGHCVLTISGPACSCDFGYTGRYCEKLLNVCDKNSCNNRGECSPVWNGTFCNCEQDWRGINCEHPQDKCLTNPCKNDGMCTHTDNGEFKCECQKYYMGDTCETQGSCLRATCVHGECIQKTPEKHFCSCNVGYEGELCDKRIDYCKRNPCMNGAACENQMTGYNCTCLLGFEGKDCEINIDECEFGFCLNGGKCRDKINDYECICDGTGYEGRNCTVDVNECENPENCLNGECTNTLGSYKCKCRDGYIGQRCSLPDPCKADFTYNNISSLRCHHGKCVNPSVQIVNGTEMAKFECSCDRGFTGPDCSSKIKEKSIKNISYLFGPIAVIVVVFFILGCFLLIFVIKENNAMHGHYSPSSHEYNQTHVPMPTVIKLPPQERLI